MTNRSGKTDEERESLGAHREFLKRYALSRVRDPALAEDAVQETLVAALAQRERFQGRAKLRTWLAVILRNKIVDLIRSRNRALPADALRLGNDNSVDAMFDANGEWADPPADWGSPDAALESNQFWRAYRACTQGLAERDALVFSMREELGMSSEEICEQMNLSIANLHVILYRSRQKLRSCLERTWFAAR